MKTIEQKAKAYDEIIERAKTMLSAGEVMYGKENNASQLITDLIPELRESEDERIKKAILSALRGGIDTEKYLEKHGTNYGEVQDWLERQKEQKPTDLPPGFYFIIEDGKKYYSKELRFDDCKIKLGPKACDDKDAIVANSEKQDYSGLTDFERAIHRGFLCAGVENVPVTIIKETAQDCLAHLPAEWTEEDKANLDNIIWLCENCEKGIENVWIPSQATQIKHLIKSLRPQSKVNSVEYERGFLAGQGSVKHWKPSDEQILAIIYLASSIPPNFLKEQEYTMRLVDEVISNLKKLCQ